MSDPVRVPPSGGPGHWRRWLLPVLASAAWLVLTFCLYRHAVQGEQAHLLELCHTRLAATAHQLMDARDWNAGHGGVYVPLSAYGEPNPWLPEKDRTLQTADGRTLVLMNPAYMSRQMAERLTEPGFRLAIVGQAPLRPGNRADDWERRILATATQGGQVFFSGEDCLPQGRLRLLRTLAAQESCLRCHQGHKEGDMLGGISISMDAAAYVRDLERKQRELGLLYGLLALTGVLAVGGITSNLTLRRLQAEEKSRLKSAFMGRLSHDMRTPLAAMLGMSDLLDRQDCGTEQRHTALAYLRRACGALLEMVDDITDHASLEQGDVRLRCRTFDLPACLRACADLYRPAAEGKGLELLLHLAPHLPRQVRGDSFRLRQALGNLVSNAVKFTERGRVDVEAGGERLASGVFLGVLSKTGMMKAMAQMLINIIPAALGPHLQDVFGFFAVPIGMMLGTDSYFFGLLPLAIGVGQQFGVDPHNMAMAMLIGKNYGVMVTPHAATTFLACGLAGISIKELLTFCAPRLWVLSWISLACGLVLGLFHL